MNRVLSRFTLLMALLSGPLVVAQEPVAETIPLEKLGTLQLDFAAAREVSQYPAEPVSARVAYRTGEALLLIAPMALHQIDYLLSAGTHVASGQAFAELRGIQVHHLELARESGESLLEVTRNRYRNSEKLRRSNSISDSQWLEASREYYAAMAEYEHLRHFFDAVTEDPEREGVMILKAPLDGVLVYRESAFDGLSGMSSAAQDGDMAHGQVVASFVPDDRLRLQAQVPVSIVAELERLAVPDCELAIERTDALVTGFFVNVWSESVAQDCALRLGQQVVAIPQLRASAFQLPATAVFDWQGSANVLRKAGNGLEAVAVEVIAATGSDYIVTAGSSLADQQVLVSSVSAVQGLLLGMGGE
tara:strand:+ start:72777 stop:73859 length:1083 start_codon:yes stop_codon:yes gene_type:complete